MIAPGALIAVTGASGFVGGSFVRTARQHGYRLRVLGRRVLSDDFEFRELDLADPSPVPSSIFDGCAAVVHLGAYIPSNQNDSSEARACFEVNALATLRLLQAAKQAEVKSFIHTSSANAYADGHSKADEITAMFPARRATYYLTSKLAQELYALHWGLENSANVVCLRLSSVYGPGQEKGALVAMTKALLRGEKVTLANGGQFGADFVSIDDVVSALMAVLRSECSGSFNIGSGQRSTMLDVVSTIREFCGADISQIEIAPVADLVDTGFRALNVQKANDAFGYAPTSMRQGIKLFVDYIKAKQAH